MSGFENMRSTVNQFLHPSVDPTDRFDPTFQGLSQKRRPADHHSNPSSAIASGLTSARYSPTPLLGGTVSSSMQLNSSAMGAARSTSPIGLGMGAHQQDQWLMHRGKRPDPYGPRHDPTILQQDPRMVQPFDTKGNMTEVRFGAGFARRGQSAIGAERPRVAAESAREEAAEQRQRLVRQRHADRERPLNPLSWAPTTTSVAYDTVNSRENNYVHFNRTAQALSAANNNGTLNANTSVVTRAAPASAPPAAAAPVASLPVGATASGSSSPAPAAVVLSSSVQQQQQRPLQPPLYPSTAAERAESKRVFPDRYATTVGPPATTGNTANATATTVSAAPAPVLTARVQRYRAEGLLRPKEWGVAEQMRCGDGYVLPEIAPTGGGRAARRQIRPQTVADTRPW